ncbi:MAG: hypothetical protein ACKV2U_18135 [Bryobacteraceae bacterium]
MTRILSLAALASTIPIVYPAVAASWSAGACTVGQNIAVAPDAGALRLNATPNVIQNQQTAPRCAQSGTARVIQFGGTPQGLVAPYNPALVNAENLTLRAKFRVTSLIPPGTFGFRLFELRDSTLNQVYDLYLENDPNGRMRPVFRVSSSSADRDQVIPFGPFTEIPIRAEAFIDLNTDYELIGSLVFPRGAASGTMRLILNGKAIALKQTTRRPAVTVNNTRVPALHLGSMGSGGQGFIGTVSELEVRDDAVNGASPRILSVVNGASFAPTIVSGSFATVHGENLAEETKDWSGSIFGNGPFPLVLGGVQIKVNGRRAAINYVSPKQVNFIAPNDEALGIVQTEVTTLYGSATTTTTLQRTAPGFFKANEKYPAAVFPDGVVLAPDRFYGEAVASRPAKSGDTVLFFLTGLGPTEQLVPAERVFTGVSSTTEKPKLYVCGAPTDVQFSGIAGFVGLYQVNAVMPPGLPEGECEVELQIGGAATPGRTVVAIKP